MKGLYIMLPLFVRVWLAGKLNNPWGLRRDLFDRSYSFVAKKYGYLAMLDEAKRGNSWRIPK